MTEQTCTMCKRYYQRILEFLDIVHPIDVVRATLIQVVVVVWIGQAQVLCNTKHKTQFYLTQHSPVITADGITANWQGTVYCLQTSRFVSFKMYQKGIFYTNLFIYH